MEKFSLFDNPKNYSRDMDRLNKMLEILWWIDPSLNPACGTVEPAPKYSGMLAYADGVGWNPGAGGKAIYWWDGSSWNKLATGGGGSYIPTSEKAAANGVASLNASSKVVQDPASASKTPAAGNIPIINDSTLLDLHSAYVGLLLYTPGSYAASNGPDNFPMGRYNCLVEADGTWPVNYGFVTGYRYNSSNHYQIFIEKATAARMWIRYAQNATTWYSWRRIIQEDLVKPDLKDWGTKGTSFTLDMSLGDLHIVDCSANLTITFSSSFTNDKAMVVIKNGNHTITLAGIDNDSPTLTVAASKQDFLAVAKSFGKISCLSTVLNKATT